MYHNRNRHFNEFNPSIFVPGLSLYVDLAEGIIRLASRVAGFVSGFAHGRVGK